LIDLSPKSYGAKKYTILTDISTPVAFMLPSFQSATNYLIFKTNMKANDNCPMYFLNLVLTILRTSGEKFAIMTKTNVNTG